MRKILLYISLATLLLSCYKTRNVNLKVINQSTDTVWIDCIRSNGYQMGSDSVNAQVAPGASVKLYDLDVKDDPHFYTKDWYHVYCLYIYSVVNESGNQITIDLNESQYWDFLEVEGETSYYVELNDTLF